jgi:tight adherence protein B
MESLRAYLNATPEAEYLFLLASVFAGVVFLLVGFYFSFIRPMSEKHWLSKRLWGDSKKNLIQTQLFKTQKQGQDSPLLTVIKAMAVWGKAEKLENLQRTLYQADIFSPVEAFLGVAGILACAGYLMGTLLGGFYWRIILAAGLGMLPFLYLRIKRQLKAQRLERQMPEGMDLLARSLRAGHTMQSAMEIVGSEIDRPLGLEMKIAFEEQRLGLDLNKALRRLAERVASQDLQFFVTAVLIQTESGGNLAEILENIGQLIRARLQLKGKIRGLTAEGRFSALILGLLPFGIFVLLYYLNRDYLMVLFNDPLGHRLLLGGIISLVFGILCMKKMVQIKV